MLLKSAQAFKVKRSLFCSMTRHTRYWRSGDDSWVEESNGEEAGCWGAAAIHRIGFLRRTFCLQGNGGQDASWPENTENPQLFPLVGFIYLFYQYSCKVFVFYICPLSSSGCNHFGSLFTN